MNPASPDRKAIGPASGAALPAIPPPTGSITTHYAVIRAMSRFALRHYFGFEVRGADSIPEAGPCLVLATHGSFLDPLIVGSSLEREVHFLARTGITHAPIAGHFIRWNNTHPIRRGGIDREAIQTCAAILNAGWPLVLFPEGTRSTDGRTGEPKGGFGMILEHVPDVPCVGMSIRGNFNALPRGKWIPRPRRVTVTCGGVFRFEPRSEVESRRTFYDRCASRLREEWTKLGAYSEDAG